MRAAFQADGRTLFTGGADGAVRAWDLSERKEPREFRAHTGFINEIALSPDGRFVALPGGRNPTFRLPVDQYTLIKRPLDGSTPPLVCKGHSDWLTCVAYRQDGKQMASGSEDKTVILWNAQTGAVEQKLKARRRNQSTIPSATFSRLRRWIADFGIPKRKRAPGSIPSHPTWCIRLSVGVPPASIGVCGSDLESGKMPFPLQNPGYCRYGSRFQPGWIDSPAHLPTGTSIVRGGGRSRTAAPSKWRPFTADEDRARSIVGPSAFA